jgi:hypothetical protein
LANESTQPSVGPEPDFVDHCRNGQLPGLFAVTNNDDVEREMPVSDIERLIHWQRVVVQGVWIKSDREKWVITCYALLDKLPGDNVKAEIKSKLNDYKLARRDSQRTRVINDIVEMLEALLPTN